MKVTVEHAFLRSTDRVDSLVEERILALGRRIQIDEAKIRLEKVPDTSPAFRVSVHLVTPGPDLLADGRDHTIQAAIEKVMQRLEARLSRRDQQRHRRRLGNLQAPAASRTPNLSRGPRARAV